MILYELRCAEADHRFEGWFRDSATFEQQQAAHEIACPVCGDLRIDRAPMAPRVTKKSSQMPTDAEKQAQVRQLLRTMRKAVEENCEHVGERFAEEARKIHYGEADARGIYGDATQEEREALADEGIDVVQIPWVPNTDS
jgi:hypothetical protein